MQGRAVDWYKQWIIIISNLFSSYMTLFRLHCFSSHLLELKEDPAKCCQVETLLYHLVSRLIFLYAFMGKIKYLIKILISCTVKSYKESWSTRAAPHDVTHQGSHLPLSCFTYLKIKSQWHADVHKAWVECGQVSPKPVSYVDLMRKLSLACEIFHVSIQDVALFRFWLSLLKFWTFHHPDKHISQYWKHRCQSHTYLCSLSQTCNLLHKWTRIRQC